MNEGLTLALTRLKYDEELLEENRALICEFIEHSSTRGLSKNRLLKYASNLKTLGVLLGTPFKTATRQDISHLLVKAEEKGYKKNTLRDYKIMLRLLYQWIYETPKRQYPPVVSWIDVGGEEFKAVEREELIESEDLKKILDATHDLRNKAMIATLWATGFRAGELLGLRVKNFYYDHASGLHGLHVDGTKTRYSIRDFPLTDSEVITLIQAWIEAHPMKNMPKFQDAPLWTGYGTRMGLPISIEYFHKVLRASHARGEVGKPSNPHNYRYSRATFMGNTPNITRDQFCYVMGWAKSSRQPDRYIKTAQKDAFRAFSSVLADSDTRERKFSHATLELLLNVLKKPSMIEALTTALKENPEQARDFEQACRGIVYLEHAPNETRTPVPISEKQVQDGTARSNDAPDLNASDKTGTPGVCRNSKIISAHAKEEASIESHRKDGAQVIHRERKTKKEGESNA